MQRDIPVSVGFHSMLPNAKISFKDLETEDDFVRRLLAGEQFVVSASAEEVFSHTNPKRYVLREVRFVPVIGVVKE